MAKGLAFLPVVERPEAEMEAYFNAYGLCNKAPTQSRSVRLLLTAALAPGPKVQSRAQDTRQFEFDSPGKMEYVSSQPFWFGKCTTLEIVTSKVSPRHVSRLS